MQASLLVRRFGGIQYRLRALTSNLAIALACLFFHISALVGMQAFLLVRSFGGIQYRLRVLTSNLAIALAC